MHSLVASVKSVFLCLVLVFLYLADDTDAKLCEHTSIKSAFALHFLKGIKYSLFLSLCISPNLRPRSKQFLLLRAHLLSLSIVILNLL